MNKELRALEPEHYSGVLRTAQVLQCLLWRTKQHEHMRKINRRRWEVNQQTELTAVVLRSARIMLY